MWIEAITKLLILCPICELRHVTLCIRICLPHLFIKLVTMPHPNYHVNLHALTKQIYNCINLGYITVQTHIPTSLTSRYCQDYVSASNPLFDYVRPNAVTCWLWCEWGGWPGGAIKIGGLLVKCHLYPPLSKLRKSRISTYRKCLRQQSPGRFSPPQCSHLLIVVCVRCVTWRIHWNWPPCCDMSPLSSPFKTQKISNFPL